MTEKEKREQGSWYDANFNEELLEERMKAEEFCFLFNHTNPRETEKGKEWLEKLLPNSSKSIMILPPFHADYGYHCYIGEGTFINHNAYLMDCAKISIGNHCFIGPNCGMYTASHPFDIDERNQGLEKADPITIGDNVWIGADVTILPGVTIGSGSVIGAKSLVSKDIPENVVAIGHPCKVLRPITKEDKIRKEK